jgi:hypothetical protein
MGQTDRKLTLRPLRFDEAVTDLLRVKPQAKPKAVKKKARKRKQR